jgi:uncharacterized protein DUF3306
MSAQDKESFLSRWSRRKLDTVKEETAPKPAVPPATGAAVNSPAVGAAPAPAKPELPPVDSLKGLASEYRDFLHPEVNETLRRNALKKLFHDPHFNAMDGLDVYIDDYSKPDPIPEAMLRTLEHAKGLIFDKEEKEEPEKPAPATAQAAESEADLPETASRPEEKAPSSPGPDDKK